MTTEELIKVFTIDTKEMVVKALKHNIKNFKKEARDKTMSADYRRFYKKLMKSARATLRQTKAEINELKTA